MPYLAEFILEIQGDGSKREFRLPPGETTIGRASATNLPLPEAHVSSNHARIANDGQACSIIDTNSRNGTKLNGQQLVPDVPHNLKDGDQIQIGTYTLVFRIEGTYVDAEVSRPEPIAREVQAPGTLPPADDSIQEPPQAPPPTRLVARTPYEGKVPPGLSRHSIRLLHFLPEIYHPPVRFNIEAQNGAGPDDAQYDDESNFLDRLLAILESILLPVDWTADNFDLFLSVYTAPDEFLPWLINWYGIAFDMTWTNAAQRAFLAEASELFAMRGTRRALARVLELYMGYTPTIIEERVDLPPHHFVVKLDRRPQNETLLKALINAHKPAHTMYTLEY